MKSTAAMAVLMLALLCGKTHFSLSFPIHAKLPGLVRQLNVH